MKKSSLHLLKSEYGFTLFELMMIVAVIGALATMAAPTYTRMLAKSRQAQAKTFLSEIYYKEQAFFGEFGRYTVCLWQIGYEPNPGSGRYYGSGYLHATLLNGDDYGDPNPLNRCNIGAAISWGGSNRNDATFTRNAWANDAGQHLSTTEVFEAGDDAGTQRFRAGAWGNISPYGRYLDVWAITHEKALTQVINGL